MKIGVSGATGQLGQAVLGFLKAQAADAKIVGISRTPNRLETQIECRRGDYDDPASLELAYAGLDRLFIIPGSDPDWAARCRQIVAAVDAAVSVRVGQIILMSDVGARQETRPSVGAAGWLGEQRLVTTAPCWTILRVNYFVESFAQEARLCLREGTLTELGESRIAFVTRNDVAAAAAGLLIGHGHAGATYNATGPHSVSGSERAEAISRIAGIAVRFETATVEHLSDRLIAAGYPEAYLDVVIDTKQKCLTGAFDIVTGDVERLSGRRPTSFIEGLSSALGDGAEITTTPLP